MQKYITHINLVSLKRRKRIHRKKKIALRNKKVSQYKAIRRVEEKYSNQILEQI